MAESSHSVHTYLNTLREELLEERASLRALKKANRQRRRSRRKLADPLEQSVAVDLDEVTIKTMADSMRSLMREFKELEQPFLQDGEQGIQQAKRRSATRHRGGVSPSSQYGDSAYEKRSRSEERAVHDEADDDDAFWAQRVHYGRYNLTRRMIWLYKKSTAQGLYNTLSKMQTRRIARQVNCINIRMRAYGECTQDVNESLGRIEDRLSRVVGLRRIE